jgi:APA family basic amino acid/polyamine antiporter
MQPEVERPFRTPGMPFVPILGALSCLYLMAGLPWPTWERLLIWLAIGLAIYFLYGGAHAQRQRERGGTAAEVAKH